MEIDNRIQNHLFRGLEERSTQISHDCQGELVHHLDLPRIQRHSNPDRNNRFDPPSSRTRAPLVVTTARHNFPVAAVPAVPCLVVVVAAPVELVVVAAAVAVEQFYLSGSDIRT